MISVASDHSFTLFFARPLNETIPQGPINAQAFFLYTQQAPPSSTQRNGEVSQMANSTTSKSLSVFIRLLKHYGHDFPLFRLIIGWDQKLSCNCFWYSESSLPVFHSSIKAVVKSWSYQKALLVAFHAFVTALCKAFKSHQFHPTRLTVLSSSQFLENPLGMNCWVYHWLDHPSTQWLPACLWWLPAMLLLCYLGLCTGISLFVSSTNITSLPTTYYWF